MRQTRKRISPTFLFMQYFLGIVFSTLTIAGIGIILIKDAYDITDGRLRAHGQELLQLIREFSQQYFEANDDGNLTYALARFKSAPSKFPEEIQEIAILNAQGKLLANTDFYKMSANYYNPEYYKQAYTKIFQVLPETNVCEIITTGNLDYQNPAIRWLDFLLTKSSAPSLRCSGLVKFIRETKKQPETAAIHIHLSRRHLHQVISDMTISLANGWIILTLITLLFNTMQILIYRADLRNAGNSVPVIFQEGNQTNTNSIQSDNDKKVIAPAIQLRKLLDPSNSAMPKPIPLLQIAQSSAQSELEVKEAKIVG